MIPRECPFWDCILHLAREPHWFYYQVNEIQILVWCVLGNLLCVFLRGPSVLDLERMRCDGSRCSPKSLDTDLSASLPGLSMSVYVCICAGASLDTSFLLVLVCFFIRLRNSNSTLNNRMFEIFQCQGFWKHWKLYVFLRNFQKSLSCSGKTQFACFGGLLAVNHVKENN